MTATAAGPLIQSVTLEGTHVRLEPLTMDHVQALAAAASEDRATYQWTFVPEGEPAMREYVAAALELARSSAAVPFATIHQPTDRVVGSTRFANFEYLGWPSSSPHYRGDGAPDGVEIGWTWLAASVQRTAVNTEAKWLMMRHAFEHWQVRVVRLNTDRRNERSRAAIQRIGGKLDGVFRANRAGADGAVRDTASFSILQDEWPEIGRALRARLGVV